MAVMEQIHKVPEDLHQKLKAKAAMAGVSISEYLLREMERSLARPTSGEFLERLRSQEHANLTSSAVEAVRAEREGR